jgi:hypothetical protein
MTTVLWKEEGHSTMFSLDVFAIAKQALTII